MLWGYMIGGRVMMEQRRDGAWMKWNLWQATCGDVLHITGREGHTTAWDGPRGRRATDWVVGPGAHWQMRSRAHWDCIWRH